MEGFDDVNTETSLGQIHGAEKHFALPVDSENKATEFRLASAAAPRMRAFPLSWISFFSCFLTATDVGNAGIASVSDAVFACLVMGAACDLLGPRLAAATLCLLTNPAVFAAATISYPTGFLLECFFTGFSLSTFVSTQFWMSSMFSAPVVGSANAVAAGWGNLGGRVTQLLIPLLYELVRKAGAASFTAWRITFFAPGYNPNALILCRPPLRTRPPRRKLVRASQFRGEDEGQSSQDRCHRCDQLQSMDLSSY